MVLTPRMTRQQCRDAIVGPARVCGIRIEEPLINQLLNDLANFAPWDDGGTSDQLDRLVRRADQLPLLQYTLNRLWLEARNRGNGEQVQLRLSDYKAIGGLSGALNTHGNELLDELTKKGEATKKDLAGTVEKIFRALVSGATVAEAVRRPQRLAISSHSAMAMRKQSRRSSTHFAHPAAIFLLQNCTIQASRSACRSIQTYGSTSATKA